MNTDFLRTGECLAVTSGAGIISKENLVTSFPFAKLAEPSEEEMLRSTGIGHEIVAISSVNDSDKMFLKLLCRNGEQSVVWLDAFMVHHLARHFEKALAGTDQYPPGPVRTKFNSTGVGSLGAVPRSLLD